jgi:hypothetical protein
LLRLIKQLPIVFAIVFEVTQRLVADATDLAHLLAEEFVDVVENRITSYDIVFGGGAELPDTPNA